MIEFFTQHIWLTGLLAFLIGLSTMPIVLQIARKQHFVVRPNKRTSHTGEIPNIGGVNIFFSVMLIFLLFCSDELKDMQFLLIGILTIVMVGFIDDVLILSPVSKLLSEMVAGIALIGFADIRITHLHGLFGIDGLAPWASYALSFFILAAIINSFNLIDGIDGLASGLGMIYCLFFAVFFSLAGQNSWAVLSTALIGALAVFFCYNVFGGKNTKIFMGDSGSLFVGYMLTAFVFRFCETNAYEPLPDYLKMTAAPAVAIGLLAIPLYDTLRVSLTRLKHRRSPFMPDKNHIHHLLLRTGLNHIQTTCILISVSLLCLAVALLMRNGNMLLLIGIEFTICTALTILLWRILDRKSAKQTAEPAHK